MAKKVYEEEKIRAIATKIREKAANNNTYTTEEMPSGIDDVYNVGYEEGVASVLPVLYGTYLLKSDPFDIPDTEINQSLLDKGVYAYFYDYDSWCYDEVEEIRNPALHITSRNFTSTDINNGDWVYDDDPSTIFPDDRFRAIDFTEPIEVSQEFYDFFMQSVDCVDEVPLDVGYRIGNAEGVEAGKKSQYDEFWDNYQDKGARAKYSCGFSGYGWNNKNFKPKYDIKTRNEAYQMFRSCKITDLVASLNAAGVILDFSASTSFTAVFHTSTISHIGIIDTRNAPTESFSQTFYSCSYLKTIDKLILANGTQKFSSNVFQSCSALVNITIEGIIGNSGLSFQWSTKLSKASITSIINALSTSVSASSGYSITLSKTAVNKAFETSTGANNGYDSDEFRDLVLARNNWTINLV